MPESRRATEGWISRDGVSHEELRLWREVGKFRDAFLEHRAARETTDEELTEAFVRFHASLDVYRSFIWLNRGKIMGR